MKGLKRIPVVLAWLIVGVAFFLLVLEESGLLVDLVRTRLAWRMGPVGRGLTIEHVSLRWFEPGVVIEGLRIHAPPEDREEALERGFGSPPEADLGTQELLHLERTNLSFRLQSARPVERLFVEGGRIRVSDRLLEGLDRLMGSMESEPGDEPRDTSAPPFALTDFDVEIELPDGSALQLGRVNSIVAAPDEEGHYRLRGRVTPVLAGLVASPVQIHVDGRQWENGLTVRTGAAGLSLQSKSLRPPLSIDALPIEEFSGELTLDASCRIDWGGEQVEVSGALRAALDRGRLLPRVGDPLLEELACDLDVAFDLTSERRLWDRELWSAKARLEGEWLGTSLEAWGEFGRELPSGTWAHAWARLPGLPLTEESLALAGADPVMLTVWRALEPRGRVGATVDVRVPPPRFEDELPVWQDPAVAVGFQLDGRAGMTYRGFPDPAGALQGIPLSCADARGLVVFARDPSHPGFLQLGFDLDADHGSGRVQGVGLASAGRKPGETWTFDLELASDSIALDENLREALLGHRHTRNIYDQYQPVGGTASFRWRLHEDPSTNGITGCGNVRVDARRLAWEGLPIPFEEARGELNLLWAREPAWRSSDLLASVRPFGLSYRFSNEHAAPQASLARATVAGFVRDDFTRIGGPDEVPLERTQGLMVDFQELLLRGRNWDVVTRRYPVLTQAMEDLNAKGGVRVQFDGGRALPDAPYRSTIEVTPTEAEVSPSYFKRRTRELRGRILVRTEEGRDTADTVETSLALSGVWSSNSELTCQGELRPDQPSRITVHGAGVDPTNTSFRGALFRALSGEERVGESLDMSDRALEGRVDFTVQSDLFPSSEVVPNNLYRIFLRDNILENASLRLEDLHGVLEQRGNILGSPRIEGALAGHPMELLDVRVFRLADASRLAIADPILQRPGFWLDPDGYAVQADLYVKDLPLDEQHLSSLLAEETLTAIRESPDWRGALDVDGARIVVTSEGGNGGKVAVRGDIVPHDLAMRFGVPVEVPSAAVEIEEMIFEAGRVRGWGRIEDLSASFFGRSLSDARMLLTYVDGRMSIDNLRGNFEGGRLESLGGEGQGTRKALAFDLAPPYHFDLALRMVGVAVPSLLEGVFQSSIADKGRIDGGLRLRGTPRNVLGITGGGWLNLDEGRLWSIPVMRELFQQLGADNTGVFDRMRTHFEVKDGRITSSDVRIRSNLLHLVGAGSIDFDGSLRYDFEVRYSLLDRLGPLTRLLYWLNNSLWRVAVRGDMVRPRVSIRNSMLEFLHEFDDDPARELPLPDFTPFPERF